MIPHRGRLGIKHYMPKKRCKYGIKIYVFAGSESAYVQKWHNYSGNYDERDTNNIVL